MLLGIKEFPPYPVCYISTLYAVLGSVLKSLSRQVLKGVGVLK